MIIDITEENVGQISNAVFADYAGIYLRIFRNFMNQVEATGILVDEDDYEEERAALQQRLRAKGAVFRNNGRSIYLNAISPACVACQKGIGSATFFVSLDCHRDCYYCFNPNQLEYDHFVSHRRDVISELDQIAANGQIVRHVALSGGEPLLHPDQAVAFFAHTTERYPDTYKRLYTCGDHINPNLLARLQEAGLEEIRFSIRMHDLEKGHRHTLDRIAMAGEFIPQVMVEMPILPGTVDIMQEILRELDALQIHSINLLEFCYPFVNAPEFNRRSFKVRRRPYKVLYNYWYAGGVPIARSELACLELMDFALDKGLRLGVHYCSLENKLTGQNYQQNHDGAAPKRAYLSEKDYLLKTAKVFGKDTRTVSRELRRHGYRWGEYNREHDFLEFHVSQIPLLAPLDVEIGISTGTLEKRDGETVLRELKVDLTTPTTFEPAEDL